MSAGEPVRSRSDGRARPGDDRGSAVAEFAVALPAVLLVLATVLGGVQLGTLQVRLQDAAADAARSLGRGDSASSVASRIARQAPTAGSRVTRPRRSRLRAPHRVGGTAGRAARSDGRGDELRARRELGRPVTRDGVSGGGVPAREIIREDRGAGAVLALAIVAAIVVIGLAAVGLAAGLSARQRVIGASDLAALAGADAAIRSGAWGPVRARGEGRERGWRAAGRLSRRRSGGRRDGGGELLGHRPPVALPGGTAAVSGLRSPPDRPVSPQRTARAGPSRVQPRLCMVGPRMEGETCRRPRSW